MQEPLSVFYNNWWFSRRKIKKACKAVGIKRKVMVSELSPVWHYKNDLPPNAHVNGKHFFNFDGGCHSISIWPLSSREEGNKDLWHELGHALQWERVLNSIPDATSLSVPIPFPKKGHFDSYFNDPWEVGARNFAEAYQHINLTR